MIWQHIDDEDITLSDWIIFEKTTQKNRGYTIGFLLPDDLSDDVEYESMNANDVIPEWKEAVHHALEISRRQNNKPFNKAGLIDSIAKLTNINKNDVGEVVNAFVSSIVEAVTTNAKVSIGGLGVFKLSERKERRGANPQTREPLTIPATGTKFHGGQGVQGRCEPQERLIGSKS